MQVRAVIGVKVQPEDVVERWLSPPFNHRHVPPVHQAYNLSLFALYYPFIPSFCSPLLPQASTSPPAPFTPPLLSPHIRSPHHVLISLPLSISRRSSLHKPWATINTLPSGRGNSDGNLRGRKECREHNSLPFYFPLRSSSSSPPADVRQWPPLQCLSASPSVQYANTLICVFMQRSFQCHRFSPLASFSGLTLRAAAVEPEIATLYNWLETKTPDSDSASFLAPSAAKVG